jgi:TonB family protein
VAAARARIDLRALDRPLFMGWAGLSIGVALSWLAAWGMLQWRRRTWRERKVGGVRVLVSSDTGPAVVGWIRGRIVLPEWVVRDADPSVRRMILQHETEHLVAGDPRMLAFALAAVALVPWSPAAWWQLRRLRLAMEVDCDARVLARRADVRAYGELLLEVGRRGAGTRLPVAAMSEPGSFLERRIRMMTQRTHPRRIRTSLGLVAFAAASLAGMQALPSPAVPPARAQAAPAASRSQDTVPAMPLDHPESAHAVDKHYPPALREAGISAGVMMIVTVTAEGTVAEARVTSSSDPRFDEAGLRAASAQRWEPARVNGVAVPSEVGFTVMFNARRPAAPANAPAALLNTLQMARALDREYPQRLRDAGITPRAEVRVRLSAAAVVEQFEVISASHPEAVVAVEHAFRQARFRPARRNDQWVASELVLPVTFPPARP